MTNRRLYNTHSKPVSGFSLIEVLIAMAIFPVITVGIVNGIIWNQKVAHYIKFENAIHANVENYIAQIKALDYTRIKDAVTVELDEDGEAIASRLPTKSFASFYNAMDSGNANTINSPVPSMSDLLKDQLILDQWTERFIKLGGANPASGSTPSYLKLRLKLSITDYSEESYPLVVRGDYCLVRLDYEWTPLAGTFMDDTTKSKSISIIVVDRDFAPDELI